MVLNLANLTNREKLNIIENHPYSLLYQVGHVMLYLGKINGEDYIIHASGSQMKVTMTSLNNSSYLKNINKMVEITN